MKMFGRLTYGWGWAYTLAGLMALGLLTLVVWGPLLGGTNPPEVLAQAVNRTGPAQPTILSGPNAPTSTAVAAYTYSDTTPGVAFMCSLDAATFHACAASGVTYSGLSEGSHTFRVEAVNANGTSSPASRSWSVDRMPPVITISFPANGGAYNASGWASGCPQAGLCGTASDASGVAGVQVAVLQQTSHKYWNGSSFAPATIAYQGATGTNPWHYSLAGASLSDGSYTVSVRATDTVGNTTPADQASTTTFTIDTVAPPAPVLTQKPDDPTGQTGAQFSFTDAESGVQFRCSLDGGTASACSAGDGVSYSNLGPGSHCFTVTAIDAAGNVSTATSYCWTVLKETSFPITGNTSQLFAPGVSQPVNLVITNPFDFDIKVIGVTITVQSGTTKNNLPNPACNGSQNLVATRAFSGSVVVGRNSTRSLPQLNTPSAQWPVLTMPDLAVNQDACKSTTFHLTYTATAVRP